MKTNNKILLILSFEHQRCVNFMNKSKNQPFFLKYDISDIARGPSIISFTMVLLVKSSFVVIGHIQRTM